MAHNDTVDFDFEALKFWLDNNGTWEATLETSVGTGVTRTVKATDVVEQGIQKFDSLVFLGIIGSPDIRQFKKVVRSFHVATPAQAKGINAGYYTEGPRKDEFIINVDLAPTKVDDTIAHEFLHRAFSIISATPELKRMMPAVMNNEFKGGWGMSKNRLTWPTKNGFQIHPEHALIYAQGHRESTHEWLIFGKADPRISMYSYDQWRELYDEIELIVRVWMQSKIGSRKTGNRGRSRTSAYERKVGEVFDVDKHKIELKRDKTHNIVMKKDGANPAAEQLPILVPSKDHDIEGLVDQIRANPAAAGITVVMAGMIAYGFLKGGMSLYKRFMRNREERELADKLRMDRELVKKMMKARRKYANQLRNPRQSKNIFQRLMGK